MKRFLRHVNFGLVLGGVLILATILVVLVTQIVFHFEKPDVRESVRDYLDDLATLNTSPQSVIPGTALSDAQKNERKTALETFLAEHWHSESVTVGTNDLLFGNTVLAMEDVRASYYNYLDIPLQGVFYDVSLTVLDSDIQIKANGPGYVKVSVDVTDASAVCRGDPYAFFTAGDPYYFTGDPDSYLNAYELQQEYGNEAYAVRFELHLELEMKRVGGEWRIINAMSNSYPIYEITVTDPKGGDA